MMYQNIIGRWYPTKRRYTTPGGFDADARGAK